MKISGLWSVMSWQTSRLYGEFHAYPASNIDFSLNFSINVDSKVEIFPSTQASNAPNAGSLQQVEGGTYSFNFPLEI